MKRRVYQFLDKDTGVRSKAFVHTDKGLAEEIVSGAKSKCELDKFYVVVVADYSDEDVLEDISQAPILLASSFVGVFYPKFYSELPERVEEN